MVHTNRVGNRTLAKLAFPLRGFLRKNMVSMRAIAFDLAVLRNAEALRGSAASSLFEFRHLVSPYFFFGTKTIMSCRPSSFGGCST